MIDILLAGGPFMFAILTISLIEIGITIWRMIFFFGKANSRKQLLQQVLSYTETRDYGRAIQLTSSSQSPLARLLNAALIRANRGEKEIRRSVETTALEEIPRVKSGTIYLPQLSNLATLLGLLGTIHGLIIAFEGAGSENAATRQAVLSQGIAIAFYNTFFGLLVATIGIAAFLILMGKMNQTLAFMEQAASSVVDSILWHRDGEHKRSA